MELALNLWFFDFFVTTIADLGITVLVTTQVSSDIRNELESLQRQVEAKATEAENVIGELRYLAETLRMQLQTENDLKPDATTPVKASTESKPIAEASTPVQPHQSSPNKDTSDLQPLLPAYRQEDRCKI